MTKTVVKKICEKYHKKYKNITQKIDDNNVHQVKDKLVTKNETTLQELLK